MIKYSLVIIYKFIFSWSGIAILFGGLAVLEMYRGNMVAGWVHFHFMFLTKIYIEARKFNQPLKAFSSKEPDGSG